MLSGRNQTLLGHGHSQLASPPQITLTDARTRGKSTNTTRLENAPQPPASPKRLPPRAAQRELALPGVTHDLLHPLVTEGFSGNGFKILPAWRCAEWGAACPPLSTCPGWLFGENEFKMGLKPGMQHGKRG